MCPAMEWDGEGSDPALLVGGEGPASLGRPAAQQVASSRLRRCPCLEREHRWREHIDGGPGGADPVRSNRQPASRVEAARTQGALPVTAALN